MDKQTAETGMNPIQDAFQCLFMGTSGTKTGSLPGKSVSHKASKHGGKKQKLLPLYRRAKNISSKVSTSSSLPV